MKSPLPIACALAFVWLVTTGSSPGATGMVNAAEVLLPTGVDAQYGAAIDPAAGYAYFGNSGSDSTGYVSMIDLHGPVPTLVSSAPEGIPAGVIGVLGVTIDTTNADPALHYLYVGAVTGQILKMSPGTATTPPQVLSTLNPTSNGRANILHGLIDPGQHYAYFLCPGSSNLMVLRVDLSTFTDAGTVLIPVGASAAAGQINSLRYGGIDTLNHFLYLTTSGFHSGYGLDNPDHPEICKINLQSAFKNSTGTSTPVNGTDYSVLDLSSATAGLGIGRTGFNNPVIDEGIVIDAAHGFAYIGTYNCDNTNSTLNLSTWPYNQSLVARISLGTGATFPANPVAGILNLQVGERDLTIGLLDSANGNLYFGTDNTYPAHVYMIHVGDGTAPMTEVGRLDLNPGTLNPYPPTGYADGITHPGSNATQWGEIYLRSGVIDASSNRLYYGSDSTPGQVTQININQPLPPANLAYATNPATYPTGTAITSNTPSSSGGPVASYSVSPPLPAGLTLDPGAGIITGTPTTVTANAAYTITATNGGGFTTASLGITIIAAIDGWRQTWYGTTSNTGNAADTADPYHTGTPNLGAFAFFGPSQDPSRVIISQLPQPQKSGGNFFYSFPQPPGVTGVTFSAEWSATLQNDWQAIPDTGTGTQHLFSIPISGYAELFIRLKVSNP